MTLVLTEVSTYGVSMAADSAVTFPDGRVYLGAQKLLPVPQLNAGLSLWGRGKVNGTDADVWLESFIQNEVQAGMTLWNMAEVLANRLNEEFGGPLTDRMGIHVGGYDERNGIRGPAFYHIHNGHFTFRLGNGQIQLVPGEDPPIRELRAHDDQPPAIYAGNEFPKPTRNGDFSIFSVLYDYLNPTLNNIQELTGLRFPHPPSLVLRSSNKSAISSVMEVFRGQEVGEIRVEW